MDKNRRDPEFQNPLNQDFWNDRWENQQTGWDIGYASPAIVEYMKQFPNKDAAILIPGCGNAYEAESLIEMGFTNVTVMDIADIAVERLIEKFHFTDHIQILCEDFFQHQGKYDLILEQTFFCAHLPDRREELAQKLASLLHENGQWVGLLFNREFEKQGPPFGGFREDYIPLFESYFSEIKIEDCFNSIPPRAGSEVFVRMRK
ncbi:MAG: methyltransferase domain-containing protein [Weeksellaceae bacterium]